MKLIFAATLRCLDCGTTNRKTAVTEHRGTSCAPKDEGHVRTHVVQLCAACAYKRVAAQEVVSIFG